jgi:hypothetical protein
MISELILNVSRSESIIRQGRRRAGLKGRTMRKRRRRRRSEQQNHCVMISDE